MVRDCKSRTALIEKLFQQLLFYAKKERRRIDKNTIRPSPKDILNNLA